MFKNITALFLGILLCFSCTHKHNSQTTKTTIPKTDTLHLLFVGDIMQHKAQLQAAKTDSTYDYYSPFQFVESEITSADLAIANLETPVGIPPYSGYPMFSAPIELPAALQKVGFNILLTANNHAVDRWGKGIHKTIDTLDSLNIKHLGSYLDSSTAQKNHPLFIEIKGIKIALMNYTYGTNGITVPKPYIVNTIDTLKIKEDLKKAIDANSTLKIICIHWGEEYKTEQSKEQIQLAKWLIKNGADHIIGSHPHVIQPIQDIYDSISGKSHIVAYSLGNFISNMSKKDTDGGLILKLQIIKDKELLTTQTSYSLVWTGRPTTTNKKNFILYPINFPKDSLTNDSHNRLIIFKQRANKVMLKNSKSIKEYFFQ